MPKKTQHSKYRGYVPLVRLPQVLVRLLGFFLEQLEFACQRLILASVLLTLVGRGLVFLNQVLKLLNLGLQYIILVRERRNLLLLAARTYCPAQDWRRRRSMGSQDFSRNVDKLQHSIQLICILI